MRRRRVAFVIDPALDYGPAIRMRSIRARGGALLREADVVVEEGPDPARPNSTVRRARRSDPLAVLLRAGTLQAREFDAAELLRSQVEASRASIPCGGQAAIHLSPHQRVAIGDVHVVNATRARRAIAAIAAVNRPATLWLVLGGTLSGFEAMARLRHGVAAQRLQAGLSALVDHYYGRGSRAGKR